MKLLLKVLLCLITITAFSQASQQIKPEWKIAPKDTLRYITTIRNEQVADDASEKDSTSIFNAPEMQEIFNQFSNMGKNLSHRTELSVNKNNPDWIDINIISKADTLAANYKKSMPDLTKLEQQLNEKDKKRRKKSKKKKEEAEEPAVDLSDMLFQVMGGGNERVVLRAQISRQGEIISTYYQTSQVNLAAMLFELPAKPVSVGDTWKASTHLIQMDQNFICDSIASKNEVKLEKIIESNGDKIAVITYDIMEFVSGSYEVGDFMAGIINVDAIQGNKKSGMGITYKATGNFSLTKGRWISYEGVSETVNNLALFKNGTTKTRTVYKLE